MSAKITKSSIIKKKAVVKKQSAKINVSAMEKNKNLLLLYEKGFNCLDWGKDEISQYILMTTLSKLAAKLKNTPAGKEIQTVTIKSASVMKDKLGSSRILSLTKASKIKELIVQASLLEQFLGMPNPADDDFPYWPWPHPWPGPFPWPWWEKWFDLNILTEINISQGIFENAKYLTNAGIKTQIQKLATKSLASASVQLTSSLSKAIRN